MEQAIPIDQKHLKKPKQQCYFLGTDSETNQGCSGGKRNLSLFLNSLYKAPPDPKAAAV